MVSLCVCVCVCGVCVCECHACFHVFSSQICVAALQFFLTGEEEKDEDEEAESSSDEEVCTFNFKTKITQAVTLTKQAKNFRGTNLRLKVVLRIRTSQ